MAPKGKLEDVAARIRAADSIALCAHVSPDGDTIGSTLAMMHVLRKMGKYADAYCQDKVPDNLRMLPGRQEIRTPDQADRHYDLFLSIDAADRKRLGIGERLFACCGTSACVDHHGTNPGYTDVFFIDDEASATALLIRRLMRLLNVAPDEAIATCLYAGISTDTGNFAFPNTTPEAFTTVAELMGCGLKLADLNRVLFRERSRAQTLLIGRAIESMTFDADGRIAMMRLSLADFAACDALPEHSDTIVNFGMNISGVQLAALGRETETGETKFSLRALKPHRVDTVAASLGGGGHELAAGLTLSQPLDQAMTTVRAALLKQLAEEMS